MPIALEECGISRVVVVVKRRSLNGELDVDGSHQLAGWFDNRSQLTIQRASVSLGQDGQGDQREEREHNEREGQVGCPPASSH